jgi:uncharacterized protein (UPF0335 family)
MMRMVCDDCYEEGFNVWKSKFIRLLKEKFPISNDKTVSTATMHENIIREIDKLAGMEMTEQSKDIEKAYQEGRRQGWDDGEAILKNREKEIIEMIEKLEKETAKNTGIDVSDVLIDGEELKAEIKGAK